jgi:NAD(P)-dependent dehydrogenase (short-subunit alcohol dehydrogenase family)
MRGLENKRVVITGGASGIGLATAARFLDEGGRVVVLDRDREAGEKLTAELSGLAGFIPCDVSDLEQVQSAITETIRIVGGIDILINNAGISIRHDFLDITPKEWEKVLGVNLNGVFYVAQTAARHMMENDGGVILHTASTNGIMGYRYYSDYNASKAGVIELTKSMALELAPRIRVNAVAPGYILTPMQRAEYTDEMLEEVNIKLPLRRHGTPDEVAALFAFLASSEAEFITGTAARSPEGWRAGEQDQRRSGASPRCGVRDG